MSRLVERHGVTLGTSDGTEHDPAGEDAGMLAALAAASIAGRSMLGTIPGARVRRIPSMENPAVSCAMPSQARTMDFDLHAGRTVRADDRAGLERLCHSLLRPPLAQARLELLSDGRVGLTLAHAWADGTRALLFGASSSSRSSPY